MAEEAASFPRRCRACDRALPSPADLGWECECGVVACSRPECMEELFKTVAGGEGIRCRTCGLVT